jgi:hypothetical protein
MSKNPPSVAKNQDHSVYMAEEKTPAVYSSFAAAKESLIAQAKAESKVIVSSIFSVFFFNQIYCD